MDRRTVLGLGLAGAAGLIPVNPVMACRRRCRCQAVAEVVMEADSDGGRSGEKGARPTYKQLADHYSKAVHVCPDIATSPNQCAVRVSRAMVEAGFKIDKAVYEQGGRLLCRHGYARGAQDLGAYLLKVWGTNDYGFTKPGSVPAALKGKTGVVLFIKIPGFDGQGHIDLWDGAMAPGEYWNADTVWFWTLK